MPQSSRRPDSIRKSYIVGFYGAQNHQRAFAVALIYSGTAPSHGQLQYEDEHEKRKYGTPERVFRVPNFNKNVYTSESNFLIMSPKI